MSKRFEEAKEVAEVLAYFAVGLLIGSGVAFAAIWVHEVLL